MAINYVSTVPWNDPYDPWPAYSQVTLSAADAVLGAGALLTLNLTEFNDGSFYPWTYTCVSDGAVGLRLYQFYDEYTAQVTAYFGDTIYLGPIGTSRKGAPVKMSGAANGWSPGWDPMGEDVNSLYIQPVYSALTPWERSRRWNLNG
jgi:hypothetical protein